MLSRPRRSRAPRRPAAKHELLPCASRASLGCRWFTPKQDRVETDGEQKDRLAGDAIYSRRPLPPLQGRSPRVARRVGSSRFKERQVTPPRPNAAGCADPPPLGG